MMMILQFVHKCSRIQPSAISFTKTIISFRKTFWVILKITSCDTLVISRMNFRHDSLSASRKPSKSSGKLRAVILLWSVGWISDMISKWKISGKVDGTASHCSQNVHHQVFSSSLVNHESFCAEQPLVSMVGSGSDHRARKNRCCIGRKQEYIFGSGVWT